MDIDDNDFLVVRKNLNILSVLILILAFTNAQLHSFDFLGIQLDMDGTKLYIALFLGYAYFIWRFLTKLPLKSGFWNDFTVYYISSEEGVVRKHNFERYKKDLLANSTEYKKVVETDPNHRLVTTTAIRFDPKEFWNLRLSFDFYVTPRERGQLSNQTVNHEIKVSKFYFIKCLIVFCVKYDKFGDYLFPLILVLINFCFFIGMAEWEGSLKSLILN